MRVCIDGHQKATPVFIGASRGRSGNPPAKFQLLAGANGDSLTQFLKTDDEDRIKRFHCVISKDEDEKPFILQLNRLFGIETKLNSEKIERGKLHYLPQGVSLLEIHNTSFEILVE